MKKVGENTFRKFIWIASAVVLLLTLFFGYQIKNTKFDYNFEKFYPLDDVDTEFFMNFREKFKSDNDFLLIAIERKDGVFDASFLTEIAAFTNEVEKVKTVQYVLSLTNQEEHFIYQGGSKSNKPYIDFNDFNAERDSIRIFKNEELVNALISQDAKAVGIYLRHEDYLSKKKSDALINGIKEIGEKYDFDNLIITGRTVGQKYYIDKMSIEMLIFFSLSAILINIFLFIAFRSVWGLIIPQIVIFLGMIWLIGGMAAIGEPINIILTVLPTIMFVVSMSDVIHLVSRYLDALRSENSTFEAIMTAVREVGLATLLTSITTAIGFFSLYFVKVQPIQVFGLVMGIGVLLAFVITFLLLPVLFYIFPGPKYVREKKKNHFWKKYLSRWFIYTFRNKAKILIISGIIVLIAIVGFFKINANNFLMDDLSEKEELKQDFNFIDAHFGGVRPFSLAITVKDTTKSVLDYQILKEIDTIQTFLEDSIGVEVRGSLITIMRVLNRGSHSGIADYFKIPSKSKMKSIRRGLRMVNEGKFIYSLIDSSQLVMQINGTLPDAGNDVSTEKMERFNRFVENRPMSAFIDYRITGTAYLIDKNMRYLSISMVKGLVLSVLIVAFIIGLIYRSISILIISLVPNVLPLVIMGGIMGYFGIELKTSTAIIFTIGFGIAVDDTIHFLGKFKYELMKGHSKMYALKRSYLTTGKAMILTTLILCAGFVLLIMSSFMGTFYLGLLLSITLFVALIADLTLLPVLLLLFYKSRKSKEVVK